MIFPQSLNVRRGTYKPTFRANKTFKTEFIFNERVDEVKQDTDNDSKTNNNNVFVAPNIIIAGGVGSFEPRKLSEKMQKNTRVNHYFIQ